MPDQTGKDPSRFSVYVPQPTTRLNLGKPEGGVDPFGYPGVSLQADKHLFVHADRKALIQSGGGMYFQTGGKAYSFSASKTWAACRWNALYAATGSVTIAAGAGHPPTTQPSTGDAPYFEPYNNLDLHYRVEEVQNALKALLFGETWRKLQKTAQSDQLDWAADAAYEADGLLGELSTMLDELGVGAKEHTELHNKVLQALEWNGNRLTSNMQKSSDFGPLTNFDPYAPTGFSKKKPWTIGVAIVLQIGVFLRRMGDVLAMVIRATTNSELIKRLKKGIGAIQAFTSFIGHVDPSEWEKYGGDVWNASRKKWNAQTDRDKYQLGRGKDTAAQLKSLRELFDLTGEANTVIEVRDKKKGGSRRIDLAPYLSAKSAVLVLTLSGKFSEIAVSKSGNGTLKLDGTATKWDASKGKWVDDDGDETDLPAGFEESDGIVQRKGGGIFEASATDDVRIDDRSFVTGDLEITVDGNTTKKKASPLGGNDAKTRAKNLAELLSGVEGISATASGASVTVETASTGPNAFAQVAATKKAHVALGVNGSARGTAAGQMTAGQLAKELNEAGGSYTAVVVGDYVQVTHDETGDDSYLEISGPLAARLFGADPSTDRGTSVSFYDKVSEFDAVLDMVTGWPGGLANMAYPAVQAVRQVAMLWKDVERIIKNIKMFLLGIGYTQAVGLIAGKAGITLSTSGGIYNAASAITLVATAAQPQAGWGMDMTKFNPLLEPPLYGIKKLEKKVFDWINNKLDPPPANKKAGLAGCRVVSDSDVQLVARQNVRIIAGEGVDTFTKSYNVTALGRIHLSARKGGVWLQGRHLQLGSAVTSGAQEPTASVALEAGEEFVRMTTNSFGVWVNEQKSSIGLGSRQGKMAARMDPTKPHVVIEPTKVSVGAMSGTMRKGLVFENGDVTLDAKSSITLGAGSKEGIKVSSSGLTLSGKVDIGGGALTVMGMPVPLAPMVEVSVPDTALAKKIIETKAKHEKALKTAEGYQLTITALDLSIEKYRTGLELTTPLGALVQELLIDPLLDKRGKAVKKLDEERVKWDALVADANKLGIDAITSKVDINKATFEVEAKKK